jgi:hypothetical protein
VDIDNKENEAENKANDINGIDDLAGVTESLESSPPSRTIAVARSPIPMTRDKTACIRVIYFRFFSLQCDQAGRHSRFGEIQARKL